MKLEKQPVLDRKLPRSIIFYLFSIAAKEGGIAVGDRLVCVSFDILYNVLKFGGKKKLNLGKLLFVYLKKSRIFSKFSQNVQEELVFFSSSFFRALWYLVFFSNANSISFFFAFFQSIKKSFDGILNFFAAYYVAHLHLQKNNYVKK